MEEARKNLLDLERRHQETKTKLEACGEDSTGLRALARRESETLDVERKLFEDLEFQQLEIEARMEEEREIIEQELLKEENEEECKLRDRKVRLCWYASVQCFRVYSILTAGD